MEISIREVSNRKELKMFIRFPDMLYKGCEYYIPALHSAQMGTLSREKNPAFEHCEARYWLAFKGPELAGRIAGIINHRYNNERNLRFMRIGWLDFVEDQQVLEALLGAAEAWAKERELEFIHGPLGFNTFDAAGVLVDGYAEWPTSFGKYNYPYYDPMLQMAGFNKDVDWVEYNIKVPSELNSRLSDAAQLVKKRYSVRNAHLQSKSEIKKYAVQIFDLLNMVYGHLYGFSTLTPLQIDKLIKGFLSLISPEYVSIVLNENDEVVGFGLVMPSLGRALKKSKGKLWPFGFFRIMWSLRFNDTVDMLLIGVRPDYQGKGVHALVFEKIFNTFKKRGIKQVETTRELEDNQKVQQLWAGYSPRLHKRSRCYAKQLINTI